MQIVSPPDPIVRDLVWLTVAKLLVLVIIYAALFAAYNGRPIDTASHLLGPINSKTN